MPRPVKRFAIFTLLAVAITAALVGYWRYTVVKKQANLSGSTIEQSLAAGDFVAARSALQGLADPGIRKQKERQIRTAELEKALSVRDTSLAAVAVGDDGASWIDPKLLERADLESARESIQKRDFDQLPKLEEKWTGKSAIPASWKLLEIDSLLAQGHPEEALKALKAASFTGRDEASRLARVALLEARDPAKAFESIDQGLAADPRNAELLSFRAQIEEAAGRVTDARLDYVAAVLADRKNPLFRDVLANFYLRTEDFPAAAETWRDAAEDTGLGVYALKSWFWSRLSGVALSKPLPECHQAGWSELIPLLSKAPADEFWSPALAAQMLKIPGGPDRPEVIWLDLLEKIRTKDFAAAKARLETGFPNNANRVRPNLALQVLVWLAAEQGQNPREAIAGRPLPQAPASNDHPFISQFSSWARNNLTLEEAKSFEQWMARPEALVGILFTTGWQGAAVIMGGAESLAPQAELPDWFDYGYAKSLQRSKGVQPAKKWLTSLSHRSIAADLYLGELQLASGEVKDGLERLEKISAGDSPQASRAAWTVALAALDQGDLKRARELTLAHSNLAESTQGKEILARVSLGEQDRPAAVKIYQELGENSVDAMIFLSKEAFAAKDWAQARKWTAALARRFPERPEFRRNLLKIEEAEKAAKP
ncbi:hypothetical protein JIN85_04440 [Luteolibacter pohnpeiensis]|uniref:Uncharacterized protein n=1 Tax=Luteolibacter pohnpeiensis TaxID=454153 RepID=A0A934VVC4_9BACT|nr:hypothetical protein [Luteolibacter pohnpeiensis]MBK1881648.1 hypothetical protein [Luteolibacter pohnpeiensis]